MYDCLKGDPHLDPYPTQRRAAPQDYSSNWCSAAAMLSVSLMSDAFLSEGGPSSPNLTLT